MSEAFAFEDTWRWLDRPPLHLATGLRGHVVLVLYWRLGCAHSRAQLHDAAAACEAPRLRAGARETRFGEMPLLPRMSPRGQVERERSSSMLDA